MKLSALLMITFLAASVASYAQGSELEGEWVSISPRTRGITRIVISAESDVHIVEAWENAIPRIVRGEEPN